MTKAQRYTDSVQESRPPRSSGIVYDTPCNIYLQGHKYAKYYVIDHYSAIYSGFIVDVYFKNYKTFREGMQELNTRYSPEVLYGFIAKDYYDDYNRLPADMHSIKPISRYSISNTDLTKIIEPVSRSFINVKALTSFAKFVLKHGFSYKQYLESISWLLIEWEETKKKDDLLQLASNNTLDLMDYDVAETICYYFGVDETVYKHLFIPYNHIDEWSDFTLSASLTPKIFSRRILDFTALHIDNLLY